LLKGLKKIVEYETEVAKKFYLIGESDNQIMGWKNNHDFGFGEKSAPQVGEIFLNLFSEPWMAVWYLKNVLDNNSAEIYEIDSSDSWEFYKGLAVEALGAKRAIINLCDTTQKHEDLQFQIYSLNVKEKDYLDLQNILKNISECGLCYNKDSFKQNFSPEEKIVIYQNRFD